MSHWHLPRQNLMEETLHHIIDTVVEERLQSTADAAADLVDQHNKSHGAQLIGAKTKWDTPASVTQQARVQSGTTAQHGS